MFCGPPLIRTGSFCSGIAAPEKAFQEVGGFRPEFFAETNDYCDALLAQRFPLVPNFGDFTACGYDHLRGEIDLVWSSTPCQAFSLAGARRGASDPRGALTLASIDIVDQLDAPLFVFENVPGILNDRDNAFGCFLAGLAGEREPLVPPGDRWTHAGAVLGPRRAIAWRLLDAQYFGLAQRRPRLFLVACPRQSALDPARILFEYGAGRLDAAPSHWHGTHLVLGAEERPDTVAGAWPLAFRGRDSGSTAEVGDPETAFCLRASQGGGDKPYVLQRHYGEWYARKATEVECERLMGFPEGYTDIAWPHSNSGHRYRVLGNSVAVPVVRWLASRIKAAWLEDMAFD